MLEITKVAEMARTEMKASMASSSYSVRASYIRQFERFASERKEVYPSQTLYDDWLATAGESTERRQSFRAVIKRIDRIAETKALRPDGMLFNPFPFPTWKECLELAGKVSMPVQAETSFVDVAAATAETLNAFGLSDSSLGQYHAAFRLIHQFSMLHDVDTFSAEILEEFQNEQMQRMLAGTWPQWKWKRDRRAVLGLTLTARDGTFTWEVLRHPSARRIPVAPALEGLRAAWNLRPESEHLAEATSELHDYVFRTFFVMAEIQDPSEIKELSCERLGAVLERMKGHYNKESMTTILPILRHLLVFLQTQAGASAALAGMIMPCAVHHDHDRSYLPTESERKVRIATQDDTLRNRALILLCLDTGLREKDILSLRLDAVDWKKDRIHIEQSKTREALDLPLLPETGNALMAYILDERPRVSSPFIFLRSQAPYQPLTDLHFVVRDALENADVEPVDGTRKGPHMLRETLVHRMIEARIPFSVISDTLGHSSADSTHAYVSLDESMLRECPLGFGSIPVKRWEDEQHD